MMRALITRWAAILALPAILASCTMLEEPVSKEDAARMAHNIEASVARHNPNFINTILDIRSFSAHIERNTKMEVPADMQRVIRESLEKRQLGREVIEAVGDKGSYRLLRQYEKEGKQHLLFRMYGNGGINYHDYELVKRERQVKAADLFLYYTGEPLSTTLGNAVMEMTDKLQGNQDENLANIRKIQDLLRQQNYTGAKEIYDGLPTALKEQRTFMMANVRICSGLNDQDKYQEALEAYARKFPDETNAPLLMIDLGFLRKDYARALKAINELDRMVGTDPFLDYYRALAYKQSGDSTRYISNLEQLYRYMPEFEDGVIELIAAYADARQYDKAQHLIAVYHQHPDWDQTVLKLVLNQRSNLPATLRE